MVEKPKGTLIKLLYFNKRTKGYNKTNAHTKWLLIRLFEDMFIINFISIGGSISMV